MRHDTPPVGGHTHPRAGGSLNAESAFQYGDHESSTSSGSPTGQALSPSPRRTPPQDHEEPRLARCARVAPGVGGGDRAAELSPTAAAVLAAIPALWSARADRAGLGGEWLDVGTAIGTPRCRCPGGHAGTRLTARRHLPRRPRRQAGRVEAVLPRTAATRGARGPRPPAVATHAPARRGCGLLRHVDDRRHRQNPHRVARRPAE